MSDNTQLYLLTYNCNKILDIGFVNKVEKTLPKELPGFLLFGFQEVCSIQDSTDQDIVNKYLLAANELLIGVLLQHYDVEFHTVAINHVGAIGLILISPFLSKVKKVTLSKYSCGMSYTSLKGGCGIRFTYDSEEYTVVSAHLNANEGLGNWNRRDRDSLKVLSGLDFGDGYAVIKPETHTFFMGDLNYRVIKGGSYSGSESRELLLTDYDSDKDELQTSMKRGSAFWGFKELPITFPPSYKFFNNTTEYNMKRVPSWCDRILFLKYDDSDIKINKYDTVPDVLTSDHHPVYLDIQIPKGHPNVDVIDAFGFAVEDRNVYLRPTWTSKFENMLTLAADTVLFGSFYFTMTSKGRVILGLLVLLLLVHIFT